MIRKASYFVQTCVPVARAFLLEVDQDSDWHAVADEMQLDQDNFVMGLQATDRLAGALGIVYQQRASSFVLAQLIWNLLDRLLDFELRVSSFCIRNKIFFVFLSRWQGVSAGGAAADPDRSAVGQLGGAPRRTVHAVGDGRRLRQVHAPQARRSAAELHLAGSG